MHKSPFLLHHIKKTKKQLNRCDTAVCSSVFNKISSKDPDDVHTMRYMVHNEPVPATDRYVFVQNIYDYEQPFMNRVHILAMSSSF